MAKIPLLGKYGKGKYAIVDDDYDGEYFSHFRWYVSAGGYPIRVPARGEGRRGSYIYLHHEVLRYCPKGMWRDHINRNKLDNRSCNLRLVTPEGNANNRPQPQYKRKSKAGYRGVWFSRDWKSKQRFVAIIKGKHIGTFDTPEEAALAYDKKAKEIWGNDALLNFR